MTVRRSALLLALLLAPLTACNREKDEVLDVDTGASSEKGTISDAMLDTDTATDEAPLDPMALPALPATKEADEPEQSVETANVGDDPLAAPGPALDSAERSDSSGR